MTVLHTDCVRGMRGFPDHSFDCIVTDPPYELGFMNKTWDSTGIAYNVEMWQECLRVLKPGGYLLSFGGARTYHRMACAIEDAGFEIRDQIMWVYGSGFPKSVDVSKALDQAVGAYRPIIGRAIGERDSTIMRMGLAGAIASNDAISPEAVKWAGWGTALKPAHEPICMARKPLTGTIAANVQAHGTGVINIDACRVGNERLANSADTSDRTWVGRWPANVMHDGSEEVRDLFPDSKGARGHDGDESKTQTNVFGAYQYRGAALKRPEDDKSAARFFYCSKASSKDRDEGLEHFQQASRGEMTGRQEGSAGLESPRAGAGRTSGSKNTHPTVKPTELMRYLIRLVTPTGGTVLDPFAGSGSTGKAAALEGFDFIGFDSNAGYVAIANARIAAAKK